MTPGVDQRCDICGWVGRGVAVGLIRWTHPLPGREFDSGPRCVDERACRDRVIAAGEEWAVRDAPGVLR